MFFNFKIEIWNNNLLIIEIIKKDKGKIEKKGEMFGLCTGYYHMYFNKPEYYVIILGLDCAGKTTLLERIKAIFSNRAPLPPQSIRPTVGLNSK